MLVYIRNNSNFRLPLFCIEHNTITQSVCSYTTYINLQTSVSHFITSTFVQSVSAHGRQFYVPFGDIGGGDFPKSVQGLSDTI